MGRIDEALRRTGASTSGATAVGNDDPFTSPWAFDDATAPPVAPPSIQPSSIQPSSIQPPSLHTVPARTPRAADPTMHVETRHRLATLASADSVLVEQFRRLAATLIHTQRAAPLKVIMVTSAAPEEGKTLTALNLAFVLSESFRRRVLLIDADLRRPKITEHANITGDGLGEFVKAHDERKAPLIPISNMLTLMPAGRPDPQPLSGLTSPRMQQLLQDAGAAFEWVIVDTPPVGAAADASLLCAMADATVLVVRVGQTPYDAVQQAVDAIGRERIIGVVLNGVEREAISSYGDYAVADGKTR